MLAEGSLPVRAVSGRGPKVSLVKSVQVAAHPAARLEQVIGSERQARLVRAAEEFRARLGGRTSGMSPRPQLGGGVAEMLQVLVGYAEDLGIATGWVVITGDAEFFAITKRLHNQIHGQAAGGPLSGGEADHYARMLAANAVELLPRIRPGDLVLLHDPQTAGLAPALAAGGARVAWRSHIGVDWENDATRAAWDFLRPYLNEADGYVFSRRQYVPAWVPRHQAWIIPPSIDPFSPKNQDLDGGTVRAILATMGVLEAWRAGRATAFTRRDGGAGTVTRPAEITGEGRPGPLTRWWSRCRGGTGSRTCLASWQALPATWRRAAADTWCWRARRSPGWLTTPKALLCSPSACWPGVTCRLRPARGSCSLPCHSMTLTRTPRWLTRCSGMPPSSPKRALPRDSG